MCCAEGSLWLLGASSHALALALAVASALSAVPGAILLLLPSARANAPTRASRVVDLAPVLGATAVPTLLSLLLAHEVAGATAVCVWALLPFFVEGSALFRSTGAPGEDPPRLLPALTGAAGLLLLLPVSLPDSPSAWAALVALVVTVLLTAASAGPAHRVLAAAARGPAFAAGALAQAVVFALAAALLSIPGIGQGSTVTLSRPGLLVSGLCGLALLFLLRELTPRRWASRTLLVPVIGLVEVAVFGSAPLTTRMALGSLLALAGTILLWRRHPASAAPLSLR